MGSRTVIAVAAAVLLLSGCASAPVEEAAPEAAVAEEVAPLVAEVPEEDAAGTPEEAFLIEIRPSIDVSVQIPDASDAQLLVAAEEACKQIADGTEPTDVRVIEGEQKNELGYYVDSSRIGFAAARTICP